MLYSYLFDQSVQSSVIEVSKTLNQLADKIFILSFPSSEVFKTLNQMG